MSEKSDDKAIKNKGDGKSSASQSSKEAPAWNPSSEPPREPPAPAATAAAPKSGSSKLAWFCLLLIIGICLAAAWSAREALNREGMLAKRLEALESAEDNQQDILAKLDQNLQARLQAGLSKLENSASEQGALLARLEASQDVQREEIARFGATDRDDWLLAEAEYLLRLANQRLIMAGDVVAATALLKSADSIMLELDDSSLHAARAAVAADLAGLRAVPKVDLEGLYLRLGALIEQVEQLKVFRMPEREASIETAEPEDWRARLQRGYEQALGKLSDYIVIRRREVPYEALMDPQWEGMIRQNMRMLLEQAQVALLSGNQVLFRESLERAGHWVQQFFEVDQSGSEAVARALTDLRQQTIAIDIPDVSRSLRELDDAMQQRLLLKDGK
ncbi:MAG: uroporphyrinogen-III C-methyltransferase [Halioglobus sp.]